MGLTLTEKLMCRGILEKWYRYLAKDRLWTCFAVSVFLVLGTSAVAKIVSGMGTADALFVPDPIFGVSFRYVFFGVAIVELWIAFLCLFSRNRRIQGILIVWLATCFILYRVGLLLSGYQKPCGCLGNLTAAIHVSARVSDFLLKIIIGYLLIGGLGMLALSPRPDRATSLQSLKGI
jgi:hypothetical protein